MSRWVPIGDEGACDLQDSDRVVTVSINDDHVGARNEGHQLGDQVPFCDQASAHKSVCGA